MLLMTSMMFLISSAPDWTLAMEVMARFMIS